VTATIDRIRGREVLDSRGRPTVEAELTLNDGRVVIASVPSGASTGRHEAVERRDGDPTRHRGKGVQKAAAAVSRQIADRLRGMPVDRRTVDRELLELDGTADKRNLGANAILAVSLAVTRAEAVVAGVPLWAHLAQGQPLLPMPMVNIISGGLHAGRQIDFQDFLIVPVGAESYSQALEWISDVHAATGEILAARGLTTLKADEGGFGPALASHEEAFDILDEAVEAAGRRLGSEISYALDIAATHFYDPFSGQYRLSSEGRTLTGGEMVNLLTALAEHHPILSIEDGLAEDDWENWAHLHAALGSRVQIVGDDLFTTNPRRVQRGIDEEAANAVLVKMNQIGTITETLEVVQLAKQHGLATVISARSGETEDPALADLAVGCAGGQIKIGSVTQSERLAKYNQLLRIEEALGDAAVFAGRQPFGARR
jgi:enolase